MIVRGPKTELLIEKLADAGVFESEAIEWLKEVFDEQSAKTPVDEVVRQPQLLNQEPVPFGVRPNDETAKEEYERLAKLPRFDRAQYDRLRHLKWHIDRGDMVCDCSGTLGLPASSVRGQ